MQLAAQRLDLALELADAGAMRFGVELGDRDIVHEATVPEIAESLR